MRGRHCFIPALLLFLLLAACGSPPPLAETLPEEVVLYYFHDTVCGSCDGAQEFHDIAAEQLADVRERYPYRIVAVNTYEPGGGESFRQVTDELGLDRDSLSLPLLIAGGRVYSGLDTIRQELREAYLVAGEDLFERGVVYNPRHKKSGDALFADYRADPGRSTVVYCYRITCEECGQTAPVIDALSGEVDVIRLNTRSGNNGERITALFEAYGVPAEDRMVPIVFLADSYLAGYDAIAGELSSRLAAGEGLDFRFP